MHKFKIAKEKLMAHFHVTHDDHEESATATRPATADSSSTTFHLIWKGRP